jgi:hypothetical protein
VATNAITLAGLLPALTADQVKQLLLSALQGIGPVQQLGQGAGVVVISGAPANNYDAILLISTSGATGAAAFKYSLDGGVNFAGPYGVPANGVYNAAGTGLAFNFAGTFVAGDEYLFQTVFPPFPVSDWESGGAARTLVEAEASTLADLAGNAIPDIAGGGFVDYASGAGKPNDWLSLLSDEVYNNQRYAAALLQGQVVFALAASAAAVTVAAGDLVVANSSGPGALRYFNAAGFTINPGTTSVQPVTAAAPGAAYNAANGALAVLQTPKPGLSVSNPAPGTSAVTPSGGANGTLAVTGAPNGNYSVVVRVLTTGTLGVATAQASLDGGTDFGSPFTIPASGVYPLPLLDGTSPTGLTLNFSAPPFTAGDSYTFTSYASWILAAGQDLEADQALQLRDKGKWTTLGVGGPVSLTIDFLCRNAPGGGSEVVKTFSAPDLVVGGQLDIVVAGAAGPVSAAALAAITAFINPRVALGVKPVVSNAAVTVVAVTGQVYVVTSQLAAAKTAIGTAIAALQAAEPIAGLVELAAVITAVMNQGQAGVLNFKGAQLNGGTADVQLAANNVVQFDITGLQYVLQ